MPKDTAGIFHHNEHRRVEYAQKASQDNLRWNDGPGKEFQHILCQFGVGSTCFVLLPASADEASAWQFLSDPLEDIMPRYNQDSQQGY